MIRKDWNIWKGFWEGYLHKKRETCASVDRQWTHMFSLEPKFMKGRKITEQGIL